MNVAEDVQPRVKHLHGLQQYLTALMVRTLQFAVKNPVRRPVGDENVGVGRNRCIDTTSFLGVAASKCPAVEARQRRSPDLQPMAFHAAINQERCIQQTRYCTRLNQGIVIPRYDDFGGMVKFPKPAIEVCHLGRAFTHEREVAGVDEDVAGRNIELAVKFVSVGDADDSYGLAGLVLIPCQSISPICRNSFSDAMI